MLAELITIGDEILIGQIIDTNSAWMAQKLNDAGVRVKQITSVSDDRKHILEALQAASARAGLIILTGGLGPTKDDITKKTLAEYFNTGMRLNEAALDNVKRIFARYKAPLLDVNISQAEVPENCVVLQNKNGTAPGMWFDHEQKIYVSLPGVPFEMMYLMEEEVIPRIKNRFRLPFIIHHTLLTSGIGESFLAKTIAFVEDALPPYIKLAYLPKLGLVRLRLSAYGDNKEQLQQEIKYYAAQIVALIPEFLVVEEDKPLEKAILDYMEERRLTLSTAESCTGGYIAHQITKHPGSSKVFIGGAVSYSNDLKRMMLGVSDETLISYGAVSEQTVTEMVLGALKNFKSDYAIAVSGIAGPDGGTADKPVGAIWIAVAYQNKTVAKKFQFSNKRIQNIERSAVQAFTMLYKLLKERNA